MIERLQFRTHSMQKNPAWRFFKMMNAIYKRKNVKHICNLSHKPKTQCAASERQDFPVGGRIA